MKKNIVLVLIGVIMATAIILTGCGKEEVEVIKEADTTKTEFEISESGIDKYSKEMKFEDTKINLLYDVQTLYDEGEINEDCREELINAISELEYDPTFEEGYDVRSFEIGLIKILMPYGLIPEECDGMTAEEIYDSL